MTEVQFYRDSDLPFFELKLCDSSRLAYKKHAHEEYSLGIVDAGRSTLWCGGRLLAVGPQSVVLIPAGVIHACNPQAENQWRYKMLFLDAGWVNQFFAATGRPAAGCPAVKAMTDKQALAVIGNMVASLTGPSGPLAKEASIISLLEQAANAVSPVLPGRRTKELSKLAVIRDYLHAHFRQKITLAALEQVSGLNRFTMLRAFKEEFAVPPHTYQTLLRINYAKRQLRQNKPVTEIAYAAGFYDQSHFIKVFKGHTGVTPEKYQRLR
ncbi:AraC family transcriptional regulator [Sporomusa termitida]|uniref:HTH-type transcriptional activator RhaS n=1 Tax=Sporomusa termitida TaxID=2377 RepID=A0A517DXZ4_9FIRM|nr:AraC family transcriptional regulator [Sporomusa termitida]QDR82230.1 HTH-type transcriptional activator RhaS [Sporomusa termitida]